MKTKEQIKAKIHDLVVIRQNLDELGIDKIKVGVPLCAKIDILKWVLR